MEPSISIIVPVYNEAQNVAALYHELREVLSGMHRSHEMLFINDGSTDNSLEVLRKLPDIQIINLNRNYGQATALDAGFKAARGHYIVSLDADLQNDPHDIPLLLNTLIKDRLDVVAGCRTNRQDSREILLLTRIGRSLRRLFIADPVSDSGCTLRVYTREAAKSLDIGGEMHRYILALLRWKGFSIGEVPVKHRARSAGMSNYGPSKAVRGFIDLLYMWFIYKYSQRPLHLFGYLGLLSVLLGILSALWTLYNYLLMGIHFARDVWLVVSFFFFLSGILFFSFGVVIDLLIRIQLNGSPYERRYYIREIIHT